MYHTEPPTDKTILEWDMKFQQSGFLCAAKRTGRPGPSAVQRVWQELDYRIDFCRVTKGVHIEHL